MLKNLRSGRLGEREEEITFALSRSKESTDENKMENTANLVATSTPQRHTDEPKIKREDCIIGQGDEEIEMRPNELRKSTSMFINHLFDMSEVEKVIIYDETEIEENVAPKELLTKAMANIMETYVNMAFNIALDQGSEENEAQIVTERSSKSTEYSSYCFLADAFGLDCGNNAEFYIGDEAVEYIKELGNSENEPSVVVPVEEAIEVEDTRKLEENKNNVALYENAYLTLNRDYDQCSEDNSDLIQQDPVLPMQDVELITSHVSADNILCHDSVKQEERNKLSATSAVSASSRKSTLMRRCRVQGARLLACLRGWWRRKTPGKRKEARPPGSARGVCPLSPYTRRRASSMLDQRAICSPVPSRSVAWKFNTVNEAVVNSSYYKEYTFEERLEYGEE